MLLKLKNMEGKINSVDFENFITNNKLKGIDFIESVLNYEQKRFDTNFIKNSVFEDINKNFGIFPIEKVYPIYFIGDITKPSNKTIFVGINPGYSPDYNRKEQKWLEKQSYFSACCNMFEFFSSQKKGLLPYFANIAGFLKRLKSIEKIDHYWLQNNLVNLEIIPYHSTDANGLRINDTSYYRKTYFEVFLRILNYLDPKEPIFVNGFPTFEKYFRDKVFQRVITFRKIDSIWKGKIGKYSFIGLPFLTRVKGGKDKLVKEVKKQL